MGYLLNVSEVLDFAVHIERSGYKFYVEAMKKLADPKTMNLFQYLADEEFKHEHFFAALKKELGGYRPPESYDGEYQAYLREFCRAHTLANPDALEAKLGAIQTLAGALELALSFEKDSIVFFIELKDLVGADRGQAIERVIREEMAHIRRIIEFKNQTGA